MGRSGIRAAYATGRGKVVVRARTEFEEFNKELKALDLDVEFPFRKITEQELIDSGLSAKQMTLIWDYLVEV